MSQCADSSLVRTERSLSLENSANSLQAWPSDELSDLPGTLDTLASLEFNVWEHSGDKLCVLVMAMLNDLGEC